MWPRHTFYKLGVVSFDPGVTQPFTHTRFTVGLSRRVRKFQDGERQRGPRPMRACENKRWTAVFEPHTRMVDGGEQRVRTGTPAAGSDEQGQGRALPRIRAHTPGADTLGSPGAAAAAGIPGGFQPLQASPQPQVACAANARSTARHTAAVWRRCLIQKVPETIRALVQIAHRQIKPVPPAGRSAGASRSSGAKNKRVSVAPGIAAVELIAAQCGLGSNTNMGRCRTGPNHDARMRPVGLEVAGTGGVPG